MMRQFATCARATALAAVLCVLLAPGAAGGADAPGVAPAQIKNPFYTAPAWRLWFEDDSPVHYAGLKLNDKTRYEGTFAPPARADRQFPDPSGPATYPNGFLKLAPSPDQPEAAGFWDDAYATLDGAHSNIRTSWRDAYGNSLLLAGQFVHVPFGRASFPERLALGLNLTSASFSEHGHQLVDDYSNIDRTEREFFFANCVRATPAFKSYQDTLPDRAIDSYDALFGHALNSLGRSGSESAALTKMLIAGGFMPRATKDLLKRHGAYAAALLTIFKASLPYLDAGGRDLPFENELRHRPAYSSNGATRTDEFAPMNPWYHGYDETRHLYNMVQTARQMTVAPPVTVVKLLSIGVDDNGQAVMDGARVARHVRSVNKTNIRIWGTDGETLSVRVDLGDSYDLQDLPLAYDAHVVYPGQRNVTIRRESDGPVFTITARHDPRLPKGRVPVLLVAKNAHWPGSPAFVNFYWPEDGQVENPPYYRPDRSGGEQNPNALNEVNRNLRPVISTGLTGDYVVCRPGDEVSFDLDCTDPEGFPVRLYRWWGEVGELTGRTFRFSVPPDDPGRVYPVHFICSDGTGGYNSLEVRLVVEAGEAALPAGWSTIVLGAPELTGTARHADGAFELVAAGSDIGATGDEGRLAFYRAEGYAELIARVVSLAPEEGSTGAQPKAGLIIREHRLAGARQAFLCVQGDTRSGAPLTALCRVRSTRHSWSANHKADPLVNTNPALLRLLRRGDRLAAFVSGDGSQWEQLWTGTLALPPEVVAGLAVTAGDRTRGDAVLRARAAFALLDPPDLSIPVISREGKLAGKGPAFKESAEVSLIGPAGAEVRYTLDGSEPVRGSERYAEPFKIDAPGDHVLKARAFLPDAQSHTAVAVIRIAE